MATLTVPKSVISEDQRLERTATTATEELAKLRWHWTLDESNPQRVSIREYARTVGRAESAIRMMVNGYAEWGAQDVLRTTSLPDAIAKAGVGERRAVAAEAIAKAKGISTGSVISHHRQEIRDTIAAAEDAAERKQTSIEEELPRVALAHERTRQSQDRRREEKRQRRTIRYIEIEGDLAAAQRRLMHALSVAEGVGFDDEEMELLRDSIAKVRAVLTLIDMRMAGTPDIDWDAELARLGEAT